MVGKNELVCLLMFSFFIMCLETASAQITTNYAALKRFVSERYAIDKARKSKMLKLSSAKGYLIRSEEQKSTIELQFIDENGFPQYYITQNENSAKTISTNKVFNGGGAGLSLDGNGVTVREWDAGRVRNTHQEFGSRVSNQNSGSGFHYHSTHVAGTIIASGVKAKAKGMAPAASLRSFDWNYDDAEMAEEAAIGSLVSNHSYGFLRGWNGTSWWGDTTISKYEDYLFGFYDETSQNWDQIAYDAPYYLIVKAAGNDRDDKGNGHNSDGPYDCIDQLGISKNILTVGAVNDITGGYSKPSDVVMTGFSSWGPADDGRIKPDIVANGSALYSTYSTADDAYGTMSGTSMAAPSVAGSAALLLQQYENIFGSGAKMRAATLKALIINTADEAGNNDGPDYSFGWGLMNTEKAALKIAEADTVDVIYEGVLTSGKTWVRYVTVTNTVPLRATLVWTDPPGQIPVAAVDPPDTILVNDLNLTLSDTNSSTVYYPWKLDKDNPANAATKGVNGVDNVEQVDIAVPDSGHVYKIVIDYSGLLTSGQQAFSLVLSGSISNMKSPVADFYASRLSAKIGQEVDFFDASTNIPTSWKWSFTPGTVSYLNGTDSLSKKPQVKFSGAGNYTVSLLVQNSYGDSTEIKSNYISVEEDPVGYCEAYSHNSKGFICNVKLSKIDNTSGTTNVGGIDPNDKFYEDWTTVSTKLCRGKNQKLFVTDSVTGPVDTPHMDLFVWIDWNRDGDFWDEGENVVEKYDGFEGESFLIAVPNDAALGNTRMRIRTHYDNDFGAYPCGNTDFGEVEDYTVEIVDPTPVSWTGSADSLWSNSANWSTATVPDYTYDVVIPSTASRFPYIPVSDTVECNSLILENSTTITVKGGVVIYGWK